MKDPSAPTTTIADLWSAAIDPAQGLNYTEPHLDQPYNSEQPHHPLGPRHDALYIVIPISVLYVLIFMSGLVGNVSTCVVIGRNRSMHTATNFYLFSLAISDLLLLVSGLPAEVYLVWHKYPYVFGEAFCVLRGLAAETSSNASVLTITAFTVERYLAICHPFLSQTMSKLPRVVKLNLSIWLVSLSCAIPQALQFGIVQYAEEPENVVCVMKTVIIQHSFELSTLIFFVVPMGLITILYALIGLKLRKSNMMKRNQRRTPWVKGKVTNNRVNRQWRQTTGKSSRRVLKMLVAVVVAFFICWAPFHVQRLIAIYGYSTNQRTSSVIRFLYDVFTYLSGVLYYISTTINPILYNIMSHKFREAFKATFAKSCKIPGLRAKREEKSYSCFSRSQHRTTAIFGSRTAEISATTGFTHESTEYSGNSMRDDSPRGTISISIRNEPETPAYDATDRKQSSSSSSRKSAADQGHDDSSVSGQSSRQFCPTSEAQTVIVCEKKDAKNNCVKSVNRNFLGFCSSTQTLTVRPSILSNRNSVKKWWQLWDWLPGIKPLKINRKLSEENEESSVLETARPHDYAISLSTFNEYHRPV